MLKNNSKRIKTAKPILKSNTDYEIPRFSLKSSLYLVIGATASTMIVPFLLSLVGLDFKAGVVVSNIFLLGYILAYTRYFIETKKGYCKGFWITYLLFGSLLGVISYFWLYLGTFI